MQNSTNEEYFFSKKKTFDQGSVYHHLGYPIGVDIEHLLKVSLRYWVLSVINLYMVISYLFIYWVDSKWYKHIPTISFFFPIIMMNK